MVKLPCLMVQFLSFLKFRIRIFKMFRQEIIFHNTNF